MEYLLSSVILIFYVCFFLDLFKAVFFYLSWWQYWDKVFVDDPGFFLDLVGTPLLFEVFTGQPKQDVFFAVLAAQEGTKNFATLCKRRGQDNQERWKVYSPLLYSLSLWRCVIISAQMHGSTILGVRSTQLCTETTFLIQLIESFRIATFILCHVPIIT